MGIVRLETKQSHLYIQSEHTYHKTGNKYNGAVEFNTALDEKRNA